MKRIWRHWKSCQPSYNQCYTRTNYKIPSLYPDSEPERRKVKCQSSFQSGGFKFFFIFIWRKIIFITDVYFLQKAKKKKK